MSTGVPSWETTLLAGIGGALIGVIGTVGAAITNLKTAKVTGASNVEVAHIDANTEEITRLSTSVQSLQQKQDFWVEALEQKSLRLIEARQAASDAIAQASFEKRRADKVDAKLTRITSALALFLEKSKLSTEDKKHIKEIMDDERDDDIPEEPVITTSSVTTILKGVIGTSETTVIGHV